MGGDQGKFTFTANEAGYHRICFTADGDNIELFDRIRMKVNKHRGEDLGKEFFEENKKDFSSLEFEVHQINDLLNTITSYQDYAQTRDTGYRKMAKALNGAIWYWGIWQIFVLVALGLFQIKSMKNFFLAKKIV